jgi:asparagine synthase (glutamine-hydrolysing)
MCGIVGIAYSDRNHMVEASIIKSMCDLIIHRGPDDEGIYINKNVGLGFRRLSIIDLTTGHQPISNENSTIWVTLNGEIYNYLDLRTELISKGHIFKSQSDTEVLVHLYEEYGDQFLTKLRGMFGLALFDSVNQKLLIARDRVGIKPLFYYFDRGKFLYGSELKAIKSSVDNLEIDNASIVDYFSYGYIYGEKSIYRDIHKLLPGHYLSLNLLNFDFSINRYWELKTDLDYSKTHDEWIEAIQFKLKETVSSHMISDVPLGAFLSGGVDSSTIVGLMTEISNNPVETFSIGFHEEKYSELKYARQVSEKFGTNHHELILESSSVDVIDKIIDMYDEPFADSSAIPTYFVSKFAREKVTVVLSGDGGDELFAGYGAYLKLMKLSTFNRRNPIDISQLFKLLNKMIPEHSFGKGLTYYLSKKDSDLAAYFTLNKDYELAGLFNKDFLKTTSEFHSINRKIAQMSKYKMADKILKSQLLDFNTYLVDDILTKVDRASMRNSLEVRVPILDHEFVELAFQIPTSFKINESNTKIILKKAFGHILPESILNRPKKGFSIPLSNWFNYQLKEFVEEELFSDQFDSLNIFNKARVRKLINNHKQSKRDFGGQIWALLVFSRWLKSNF